MPPDVEHKKGKLLLVEDSIDDAELVLQALASYGFDFFTLRVECGEDMGAALLAESWDAVLSDYNLPRFSAEEALALLKARNLDIPFVVVSGCIGEEAAVDLMKAGAHDFVMKDNLTRLGPAVRRELGEAAVRRERRLMQEKLDANEKLLRGITSALGEGIMLVDDAGRIGFMNPEAERVLGWAGEELAGQNVHEKLHFKKQDGTANTQETCSACRAMALGRMHRCEDDMFVRKNGEQFPVSYVVTPVMGGGRRPAGSVMAFRDITVRKRMESELKRWADVFRHAQWGVAIESADGKSLESMNPVFAHMHGYSVEELSGAPISNFFPPECCQIPLTQKEDNPRIWESKHVRKDGSVFPVLINVSEVCGESGEILYHVVNVQDITRLKQTEKALQESEINFSAITRNVPGMVFQYVLGGADQSGRFSFVSEGAFAVCGLTPGELQAHPDAFMALFSEADRRSCYEARYWSARELAVWNWEGCIDKPAGREKWLNIRATPRRLDDGDVIWDGVIFNITESKQKEEEIRRSRELLRQLSAHRDSVREDERKRIAREIHDELGQALTALKIDVDWLAERLAPQQEKIGDKLQAMSHILNETVNSVRRIAEHLRPGMLDDLGLAAAIEWQVEQFKARTGIDCGLDMNRDEFELDDRLATCIFRVVQEALTNVVRHAAADKVHVTVKENNGVIGLEVNDNGRGFHTRSSDKRSYGLLGIKERVKILGGEVEVISQPGSGTCVRAHIPFHMTQIPQ